MKTAIVLLLMMMMMVMMQIANTDTYIMKTQGGSAEEFLLPDEQTCRLMFWVAGEGVQGGGGGDGGPWVIGGKSGGRKRREETETVGRRLPLQDGNYIGHRFDKMNGVGQLGGLPSARHIDGPHLERPSERWNSRGDFEEGNKKGQLEWRFDKKVKRRVHEGQLKRRLQKRSKEENSEDDYLEEIDYDYSDPIEGAVQGDRGVVVLGGGAAEINLTYSVAVFQYPTLQLAVTQRSEWLSAHFYHDRVTIPSAGVDKRPSPPSWWGRRVKVTSRGLVYWHLCRSPYQCTPDSPREQIQVMSSFPGRQESECKEGAKGIPQGQDGHGTIIWVGVLAGVLGLTTIILAVVLCCRECTSSHHNHHRPSLSHQTSSTPWCIRLTEEQAAT